MLYIKRKSWRKNSSINSESISSPHNALSRYYRSYIYQLIPETPVHTVTPDHYHIALLQHTVLPRHLPLLHPHEQLLLTLPLPHQLPRTNRNTSRIQLAFLQRDQNRIDWVRSKAKEITPNMYGLPRPQYQKIPLVDFFQFLVEVFFEGGFEFGFEFVVGGEGKEGGCELVVYEFDML